MPVRPSARRVTGLLWLVAACLLPLAAQAATVYESGASCDYVIDGPITPGDFDKLSAFRTDPNGWRKDGLYHEPVLCLNSPGGSLTEGARIAQFVYETGLQTRVGDGAICHSICAIIFMMGNKHSGPTTVEENRTLHVGGDLAFHSPSISIDSGKSYSAAELELAYKLGLDSILNIINLANSQRPFESGAMMHPGLIKVLLDTPASELYHITTIEQALSWDIGLDGVPEHLPQTSIQQQMVCENGLMRGFRRPSEIYDRSGNNFMTSEVFDLVPLSESGAYRLLPDFGVEELAQGIVYSYRYWALPVECQVRIDTGAVQVCGVDSAFNNQVGDCYADHYVNLPDHARYHPMTEFRALQRSGIAADVLRSARCTRRSSGGAVLRDGTCVQAIDIFKRDERKFARHTLHWDNLERTVIEISARPYNSGEDTPDIYRIDGMRAEPLDGNDACLRVPDNSTVFCVTDP